MFRKIALLLIAGLLLATSTLYAQDEYEVSVWNAVEVVDGEPVVSEADALPLTVAFLTPDDGETLIAVWSGPDIVYTQTEDDTYSGVTLVSEEAYEFEATLEIIDEETMQSTSTLDAGAFTSESIYRYELSEDAAPVQIYSEGERDILEYSQLQECLGRTNVEPGRAFTIPDLLMPLIIDPESDVVIWDQHTYTDGGGGMENVETTEFGTLENVITRTLTPAGDDSFAFRFAAIAGERDDCEMIYESTLTPFDGDFEALFARAEVLSDGG